MGVDVGEGVHFFCKLFFKSTLQLDEPKKDKKRCGQTERRNEPEENVFL